MPSTLGVRPKRPEMRIMGPEGDERINWDADDPDDVKAAKAQFDKYKSKGYLAYRQVGLGKGEQIREFDPLAERIILAAPMVGG